MPSNDKTLKFLPLFEVVINFYTWSTTLTISNIDVPVSSALRDLISAHVQSCNRRGQIMYKLKANALSTQDRYTIGQEH